MKTISAITFVLSASLLSQVALADAASEDEWLRYVKQYDDVEYSGYSVFEEAAIPDSKGRAERRGDVLTLHLTNGKALVLTTDLSCPEKRKSFEEQCHGYQLVADLPSRHAFLVNEKFYEGSKLWLISDKTGVKIEIGALPYFSPDGNRFLTLDNDMAYGTPGYIEIWTRKGDDFEVEWHTGDANIPYWHSSDFVSWTGDTIKLKFWRDAYAADEYINWPATLTKMQAGWVLKTKWPNLPK